MNVVQLREIIKNRNKVCYDFCVSENLNRFFSGKEFVIEYPDDIECVPDGILAIPFVCNVLPIIWLTD